MKPIPRNRHSVSVTARRGQRAVSSGFFSRALPAVTVGVAAVWGALALRHDAGPQGVALLLVAASIALAMLGATRDAAWRAAVRTAPAPGAGGPRLLAMEGPGRTPAFPEGNGNIFAGSNHGAPAVPDRLEPEYLPADWLAGTRAVRQGQVERGLHRALDISASLALLALTLPLMLLVAVAICVDSPGPVLYRQERVGRRGRVFRILKFRSMKADAEAPGEAVWAAVGDPRVTRVGRLLRLTRIDEIPQAINVLRGDMAFVGPRPERPAFVAQLEAMIPHYADRAVVRPGLTGWAQVRLAYGASVDDARNKLAYDLYYVQRRSIWFDLRIILATVRVVLRQAGAR